ncbi:MBL fold metallo-hydrolase [Massilia sp. MS-15]|uniref:MBL fold metallo-hydrolase n=1 Tax=Massilia sp. MS-15 TaxID=2878200 RepID=UPI001CD7905B|nr:MBL fold metallo-hydrolase [Massilia sp. MS-15]MCA1248713.1 MBL fold metallo-hydrolase [Massilia sp. MS-15]
MKITQLRNATAIIELGPYRILVDPMLAPQGSLPALKLGGGRQRNPTVGLPAATDALLADVTHCLITHCQKGHFDHLDRAGRRWLRERAVPVICSAHDAAYLQARGLNVAPLAPGHAPQPLLGGQVTTVPCRHGRGALALLMEHGVGYYLELPGEPTLYLSGDTVLTPQVLAFVERQQPEVCLVPAGGARFDLGGEIIMDADEVVRLLQVTRGLVVANHLEALSHCPVTRRSLLETARTAGVAERLWVPDDGASLRFTRRAKGGAGIVAQDETTLSPAS